MIASIAVLLQAAIPTPPVNIDHVFVTVDKKTWDAIRSSKWLKQEFADVSVSTHTDGESTWTGCYVYGAGTYLEIFAPHQEFKEGQAGIGFSTTAPGGADNIDAIFRKGYFGNRTERELMNIGSKGKLQPFAHIVSYKGQDDSSLSVWLMEFHEEYFRNMGVPVGSSPTSVFEAYRKVKNQPVSRKLMRNLVSVTVNPPNGDLAQALRLFGFRESPNGKWVRASNEFQLGRQMDYAISSVRMSLRKSPKHAHTERFGKRSYLQVRPDGFAEWHF